MHSEEFQSLIRQLGESCLGSTHFDEREVVTLFVDQGFFSVLGFGMIGEDLRIEQRIRRGRADVVLRGVTGRPICVIEFKRPGTDLSAHLPQLAEYVTELLPEFAALTDGTEFRLYRRRGETLEEQERFALAELGTAQAERLYQALRKRTVDWQRLASAQEVLRTCREQPIQITSPDEEGGRIFLQQFALSPHVAFGKLVQTLFESLSPLLERSDFTRGAYAFWEKIYARELSKGDVKNLARTWETFVSREARKRVIYHFMFALETAYAVLSRLLLAKAMQDARFPLDAIEALEQALGARDRRGALELTEYVPAVAAVFEEGKRQAFRSLFAGDIFDWWLDLPKLDEAAHEACEALAEVTLAVFQFDFSGLSGDLLGALYQSYFDPETRKALGEFYTPPEVVEFILDQVGYRGPKVLTQRLLDPACGSGTFLVHALKRYLSTASGRDPREVLRSLAEGFRIVGFDINPFAVLMAQANYALHLLPTYAAALERDRSFEIATLPVFRTDSLRQEKREGEREEVEEQGGMRGFTFEAKGDIATITTELPVEVKRGEFLQIKIPVPRYDRARHHGWVGNVEEYFKVQQALFAAVRESRERDVALPAVEALRERLARLGLAHAAELARYVHPTGERILETLSWLKEEYEDGRFLKTLEDLALAMTLKHELRYDYVVGNPPYVRIQNIPELSRRYWQGIYGWAEGSFDIYIPFIERSIVYWLKEEGRLGFICSNRFLLANYAEKLRSDLPQLSEIELVFDLRDTRVFKDALNYPAILIARRTDSPEGASFVTARVFADPGEGPKALLDEVRSLIQTAVSEEAYQEGEYSDAFIEEADHLAPQGWYLMPAHERRVFRKLERAATHRLQELTLTESGGFAGYQTSADSILVLKLIEDRGDVLLLQPKGGGAPVEIERALVRPWLFGRDVERWHIAWDSWYVLFPYAKIDGVYKLIPSEQYEDRFEYAAKAPRMESFPLAWQYYKQHEDQLRRRESGRFRKGSSEEHLWHGAAYPRSLELYEKPKILVQTTSIQPDMAYDDEGRFVFAASGTANVYGVLPETRKINPRLLLALLNSQVLDFFLKHCSVIYAGKSYAYGDQFIKQLPIRLPKTQSQKATAKRLAELAQELTQLKGRLRAKERERRAFPQPQLSQLEHPEVYPLARLVRGEPQARQISVDDVTLQHDGSWALTFGRSELIFPSKAHAQVAEAWLRVQGSAQVSSADLMRLRLPASEQDCRRLLERLAEIEQKIERLQERIAEGETEVDDLAAKLYGLSQADRKVIGEFLARF